MSEMIKKISLFGIGMIALTQEKLEEFTSEMVTKGEMNREEGKKFVREVLIEKDRQLKELGDNINKKVKDAIDKSGFASKSDIEKINNRLQSIEKKFNF